MVRVDVGKGGDGQAREDEEEEGEEGGEDARALMMMMIIIIMIIIVTIIILIINHDDSRSKRRTSLSSFALLVTMVMVGGSLALKAELGWQRTASVAIIKADIIVILQTLMIATQAVRRWIAANEVIQDSIRMTRVVNILRFNYILECAIPSPKIQTTSPLQSYFQISKCVAQSFC